MSTPARRIHALESRSAVVDCCGRARSLPVVSYAVGRRSRSRDHSAYAATVARRRALQFCWQTRHFQFPPALRVSTVVSASVVWHKGHVASRTASSVKGAGTGGGGEKPIVIIVVLSDHSLGVRCTRTHSGARASCQAETSPACRCLERVGLEQIDDGCGSPDQPHEREADRGEEERKSQRQENGRRHIGKQGQDPVRPRRPRARDVDD